jgi:hypothetical protein
MEIDVQWSLATSIALLSARGGMKSRNQQHSRRVPQLGGVVTVTPIRDRSGEGDETFSVSWHSPSGDLRWLSPRISSEAGAEIAAAVLSEFVRGAKR